MISNGIILITNLIMMLLFDNVKDILTITYNFNFKRVYYYNVNSYQTMHF